MDRKKGGWSCVFFLEWLQWLQYPHLVMQIIFLGVQYQINNLEITDLIRVAHANPASLRTQENNFGSKYVKNISRLFCKRPATARGSHLPLNQLGSHLPPNQVGRSCFRGESDSGLGANVTPHFVWEAQ